jgi:hypothetical protein
MLLLLLFLNIVLTLTLPHGLPQGNYTLHHHLTDSTHSILPHNNTLPPQFFHPRTLLQLNTTSSFSTPHSPASHSLPAYKIFLAFFIFGIIAAILFLLLS